MRQAEFFQRVARDSGPDRGRRYPNTHIGIGACRCSTILDDAALELVEDADAVDTVAGEGHIARADSDD